jgi:hypothetical protein
MIDQLDVMTVLPRHRGDALVVPVVGVETAPDPRARGRRAQEMARGRRPIRQAMAELRRDLGVD